MWDRLFPCLYLQLSPVYITAIYLNVLGKMKRQEYAARFGVSSERFGKFLKLHFCTRRSTGLMQRTFVCQNVLLLFLTVAVETGRKHV